IAIYNNGEIDVLKCKGRLAELERIINEKMPGNMGIGHTRWATHGEPSNINSHPHMSKSGQFAIVHNGIVENYLTIREALAKKGFVFISETDTEVIAHMFEYYYDGDMLDATKKTISHLNGSYALGILCRENPDSFIAVRKDSPLVIGKCESGNFIASDVPAILPYTRKIYYLEDNEIAIVGKKEIKIYDADKEPVKKKLFHVEWETESAEKCGYEHFMFKEIMQQPSSIRATLLSRIDGININFENLVLNKDYLEKIRNIYIIGCGSAYHAGVLGKYIIEDMTRIFVECEVASEFRYRNPIVDEKTLILAISQSGETLDTISAVRYAKKQGAKTISIVNVVNSTLARETENVIYMRAGPEIAVATTKCYNTQLIVIYLFAIYISQRLNLINSENSKKMIDAIINIPDNIEKIFDNKKDIQYLASKFFDKKNVFFIGRKLDYAVCLEGSLKLKEISYIHSEAYAAGELKHGTIALIEEGTLVIAVCTSKDIMKKMISNIKEVKARGAVVIAIASEELDSIGIVSDYILRIPNLHETVISSLSVITLQLFAYYISSLRGLDIDKPRNLAKSVTVE
ncbi:MAG: glutamine--fructose-6-phosphate transaminase (isomerizing), partial [Clostridiales bacterium]|nr:glutamine--fructose-6-phosphate transaminase (isomerizing) [Clostridiales bacterium]